MRAAVLGNPVVHSLSPVLHRSAYAALDLEWSYDRVECREDELAGFLAGLDASWAGLSLTMPLKRVAVTLADTVTPLVRAVDAANTLIRGTNGWSADNTDIPGLENALREAGLAHARRPVLVGGGATACSAAAALAELGAPEVTAVVRDAGRARGVEQVAERFGLACTLVPWPGEDALAAADLVVSTVPGGAADELVPYAAGIAALFDVTYAPWPTPFAAAVGAAGGTVVGGFELLLHQAALQVAAMTGRAAPLEPMRAAGEAELAARAVG